MNAKKTILPFIFDPEGKPSVEIFEGGVRGPSPGMDLNDGRKRVVSWDRRTQDGSILETHKAGDTRWSWHRSEGHPGFLHGQVSVGRGDDDMIEHVNAHEPAGFDQTVGEIDIVFGG